MNVSTHFYETTVQLYRDVVGLKPIVDHPPSMAFEFGGTRLWIDRVSGLSQAEIWLESITNDMSAASEHLKSASLRCNEIEPFPEGLQAFWVFTPASIVHLVCQEDASW